MYPMRYGTGLVTNSVDPRTVINAQAAQIHEQAIEIRDQVARIRLLEAEIWGKDREISELKKMNEGLERRITGQRAEIGQLHRRFTSRAHERDAEASLRELPVDELIGRIRYLSQANTLLEERGRELQIEPLKSTGLKFRK